MEFHKYTISKKGIFRKSFEIYEDEKLIYNVKCQDWFSYRSLSFTNTSGEEVLLIKRPFQLFKFKFDFLEKGEINGVLTKSNLSNEYTLKSTYATYVANGNWLGNEYTIYLGEIDIAKVSRKTFSNKNKYGIAIIEGNHNLFILGMVISIELVKMIRKKRSS